MPTQWRTIAPIVGRTATQCLERYQKLLDEAEAREASELGLGGPEGGEGAPAAEDARRLKPGEVDVDQETKAARPDPVDMDEDEKEMLSEARARLANTQGKKAKRKARERQLEEARRLAALQKKRELKAAGIILRHKPKKGSGMDYNADIPFNKQPAPGFYDVSDENAKRMAAPVGQSLREIEGKRRIDLEDLDERKKKRKNDKGGAQENTQFIAAREAQIQKLKETEQIFKRRKLNLPQPQVGEAELEDIVKIGRSGQTVRDMVGGEGATGKLIGDYDALSKARTAKTPRTAPQEDNVMAEALNLRDMTTSQTPLLGDENTPLHGPSAGAGTGFEGATPRHHVSATPNPLATPLRPGQDIEATPQSSVAGQTPLRTPMRDSLSINQDGSMSYGDTPRELRMREQASRKLLQAGFASLPAPENNFEFDDPETEELGDEVDQEDVPPEEDAAERDARLERLAREEEARILARRSAVVKQDLPRPVSVNFQRLIDDLAEASPAQSEVEKEAGLLIDYELAQLMLHDAIVHPLPASSVPAGTVSQYEIPDDEDMVSARQEIHKELAQTMGLPGASETQIRESINVAASEDDAFMSGGWVQLRQSLVFDSQTGVWVEQQTMSESSQRGSLSIRVAELHEKMVDESGRASKSEKKLAKQLGGYQMINKKLNDRIATAMHTLRDQQKNLIGLEQLKVTEDIAGPQRVVEKREEVEKLEKRERDLQDRYADLAAQRKALVDEITGVSLDHFTRTLHSS